MDTRESRKGETSACAVRMLESDENYNSVSKLNNKYTFPLPLHPGA